MSGYAEMARDIEQQRFLDKWVPSDDPTLGDCPEDFRERYRFTLARARAAEGELKVLQGGLREFHNLIGRVIR